MPHDPSLKRGNWMSTEPYMQAAPYPPGVLEEVQVSSLPPRRRAMHAQPRGKRGGRRCARKNQASARAADALSEA
jgi:hypothetical protein